jgi:hypothetical protein
VRVYPPIPQVEAVMVKLLRTSLPRNLDSVMQRWNFQTMAWEAIARGECETIPSPYCLSMPSHQLVAFATELLKGALRVENV